MIFSKRKKLEIQNRVVETIGTQSEQFAQKSAEKVLQSAWTETLNLFAHLTYLAVIPIYLFYFLAPTET